MKIRNHSIPTLFKYFLFTIRLNTEKHFFIPTYSMWIVILKLFSVPTKRYDLVIIDDTMPNIMSAYRTYEFSYYIKNVPNVAMYCIIDFQIGKKRYFDHYSIPNITTFAKYKNEFIDLFKVDSSKILPLRKWTKITADFAYIVFLNNAYAFIDYLEERNIKFILELYPGGGFEIDKECDGYHKLVRVLSSKCLANVIVTQKVSKQFLLDNKLCSPDRIVYVYGVILAQNLFGLPSKTIFFGVNKNVLDICFVSNKYMPQGLNKGYDIFIGMAIKLLGFFKNLKFHIVGGYNKDDIAIGEDIISHFYFYKHIEATKFIDFYKDKDIFIAPCRPFLLSKGNFDGFPTGTCCDAGLNELCMLVSDELELNEIFTDKVDMFFLKNDVDEFVSQVEFLYKNPSEIYRVGKNGKNTLNEKVNIKDQLNDRLQVINNLIKSDK